ncbi:MAG: hypoxanthine phosphoribosyltransferase, partial [Bacteroidales bacterium]|nr:hypoxanthine phosphoribosyltransferase [Bacteroidales bacterium]
NPLFLAILNGSFIFAADLLKKLDFPCEISFVKISSYRGTQSSSKTKQLIGLSEKIEGRSIVIIEDIIDTGLTLYNVLDDLKKQGASEVKIVSLLFKPDAFRGSYKVDYIGKKIPNEFIVGYGLDYNGYGRNHPDIYQIITE